MALTRPSVDPIHRGFIDELVHQYWDFRLKDFQLDILMDLLQGGIYSIVISTDHGKSTLLEMSVVIGLILRPSHSNIVVKISKEAAQGTLQSIAGRLLIAAEDYPDVKPLVRIDRAKQEPMVGHGFMVAGGNFMDRRNPSVYGAALGERDLQGRRGRTHLDDLETEMEGTYHKYRERLEGRVGQVLRTIEDKENTLWALFGTPQHDNSIYFSIPEKLRGAGNRHKLYFLPYKDPVTGAFLWPERANKIELHRRVMNPSAFRIAYELNPKRAWKPGYQEIESIKDRDFPHCRTTSAFRTFLEARYENAEHMVPFYYIGWDPSAGGDYAIAVMAEVNHQWFLLDSVLEAGDSMQQVAMVSALYERYPESTIIIEQNAQQKAFRDMLVARLPKADIVRHQTTSMKNSDVIGVPAFISLLTDNRLHLPWSEQEGINASTGFIDELERYDPVLFSDHPHLLVACWFCFYWHEHHQIVRRIDEKTAAIEPQIRILRMEQPSEKLRKARMAWGKKNAW